MFYIPTDAIRHGKTAWAQHTHLVYQFILFFSLVIVFDILLLWLHGGSGKRRDALLFPTHPSPSFDFIMGKTKNLKSALQSQQTRQKLKEQTARTAKITEAQVKAKRLSQSQGKGRRQVKEQKSIIPFIATDTILLIGEGNFSFARALVIDPPTELIHLPPGNVTATAYDSEEDCYLKYPDAADIVASLRERGVQVLFGIDATKLDRVSTFKDRKWDKICWNFPHAGEFSIIVSIFLQALTIRRFQVKA